MGIKQKYIIDLIQIPKIISFLGYTPSSIIENAMKIYRIEKGISQKELTRILEIDPTTLVRIERGSERISEKIKTI